MCRLITFPIYALFPINLVRWWSCSRQFIFPTTPDGQATAFLYMMGLAFVPGCTFVAIVPCHTILFGHALCPGALGPVLPGPTLFCLVWTLPSNPRWVGCSSVAAAELDVAFPFPSPMPCPNLTFWAFALCLCVCPTGWGWAGPRPGVGASLLPPLPSYHLSHLLSISPLPSLFYSFTKPTYTVMPDRSWSRLGRQALAGAAGTGSGMSFHFTHQQTTTTGMLPATLLL